MARTLQHRSAAQGPELAGALGQGKVAVLQRIHTVRDNCQALLDRTQTAACTHAVILRAGAPGVIEKLDKGEAVDPRRYYFRMNPMFETSAPKYDWMNRIMQRLLSAERNSSSISCEVP